MTPVIGKLTRKEVILMRDFVVIKDVLIGMGPNRYKLVEEVFGGPTVTIEQLIRGRRALSKVYLCGPKTFDWLLEAFVE
jgi:hypothetical protein